MLLAYFSIKGMETIWSLVFQRSP